MPWRGCSATVGKTQMHMLYPCRDSLSTTYEVILLKTTPVMLNTACPRSSVCSCTRGSCPVWNTQRLYHDNTCRCVFPRRWRLLPCCLKSVSRGALMPSTSTVHGSWDIKKGMRSHKRDVLHISICTLYLSPLLSRHIYTTSIYFLASTTTAALTAHNLCTEY